MVLSQDLVDDTVYGLAEFISLQGDVFMDMILTGDMQTDEQFDIVAHMTSLYKALLNYSYSSGFFTDAELTHLIEQANIRTDQLPNNSNYGGR